MAKTPSVKYLELKEQAAELLRQAEALRRKERNDAIAGLKASIEEYEITARELGFSGAGRRATSGSAGKTVPIKYVGPNGESWSGRGRQPVWFRDALASGKTAEDLLV